MLPAGTPQGLARAALCRSCTVVGGEFLSGFVLYGIPVGLSRLVKHHIPRKIAEVAMEVREVLEVLQGEGQALWIVLRSALS